MDSKPSGKKRLLVSQSNLVVHVMDKRDEAELDQRVLVIQGMDHGVHLPQDLI